ncbi:transmembrane emp24 domain containing protein 2 precursor, putative [Entamoeba invadens IP1]|uniref:Transmembrane emp24 domain containing protein 2, putative n=1 Tax=Entamoeba invadens IP1 TaxID=370355 RepID=A0A0A1TZA7_ENTIV|nr:transmembrane emp24 domain containing protein 2 precursor, putative [Entamoeba invadens IP1]ELP85550.1 transmembrane emp24 domain containing protein 2 precursor, putative [Entamoeba invadens IP1]|eukprot:XP_004184896.1 transmembrane emp24 domain containing protein 2 precursor, putative [Entamoeba invadens IP1]
MLFVLLVLCSLSEGYRFVVQNRAIECVYADITGVERVVSEIAVVSGGNRDIAFKISDPAGNNIYSIVYQEGKYSNLINVNTKTPGTYSFCFDNSMSLYTGKLVEFKLQTEKVEPATTEEVKSIKTKLSQVATYLNDARNDQRRLRTREIRNKKTGDGTNLRTLILFFVGCVVIVVMGLFQIWYIKRQFKRGGK